MQKHSDTQILNTAGIEILPARSAFSTADVGEPQENNLPVPEKLEINGKVSPSPSQGEGSGVRSILAQKLSAPVQTSTVKTDHTLPNITPPSASGKPTVDPYREIPE